jgi:hypothetical protein
MRLPATMGARKAPARATRREDGGGGGGDGRLDQLPDAGEHEPETELDGDPGDDERADDQRHRPQEGEAADDRRRNGKRQQDDRPATTVEQRVREDAAAGPREDADGGKQRRECAAERQRQPQLVRQVGRRPAVDEEIQRVADEAERADRPDTTVAEDARQLGGAGSRRHRRAAAAAAGRPEDRQPDDRGAGVGREDGGPAERPGDQRPRRLPDSEADRAAGGERRHRGTAPPRPERPPDDVDTGVPDDDVGEAAEDARAEQRPVVAGSGGLPPPDAGDQQPPDGGRDGVSGVGPVENDADRQARDDGRPEHDADDQPRFGVADAQRRPQQRRDARGGDLVGAECRRDDDGAGQQRPPGPAARDRRLRPRLRCHVRLRRCLAGHGDRVPSRVVSTCRVRPVRPVPAGRPDRGT